ncbi:MAG: fibronectin type III domain-containing protein, partial [bacterium]
MGKKISLTLWILIILGNFEAQANTTPQKMRITNLRDTQFTISWITATSTIGQINYGTTTTLVRSAYDDRGSMTLSYTHHITITKLIPLTTYYYDIISGESIDNNNGKHYSIITATSTIPSGSDVAWGTVTYENGTTNAEGAIIYIQLQDNDGQGNTGSSAYASTLVDLNGIWNIELVNIRTQDHNGLFAYSLWGDNLFIFGEGAGAGIFSKIIDTANDSPAPLQRLSFPPIIANIIEPASNTFLAGTVTIKAQAQDNESGIDKMELWVGTKTDCLLETDISAGIPGTTTSNLITTNYLDGIYDLFCVAIDHVGNRATSTIPYPITIDNTKPQTPTLVSITNGVLDGKLNLIWTPGTDTNLVGYKIHYGTESGTYTSIQNTGTIATTYTLGNLTNGICYYMAISAYDQAGNEGDKSNELFGIPTGPLANIRIIGATATITTDETLILCLKGYDGNWNLIGEVFGTWSVQGGIGTCSPAYGTSTVFAPTSVGSGTITATDGLHTDTMTITIKHGTVTAINLHPLTISLTADEFATFTAIASDSDGNTWTVTSETTFSAEKGTFTNNVYNPKEVGTWTITGTTNGIIGTATVVVTSGAFTNLTLNVFQTMTTTYAPFTLTVTLTDSDGNPYTGQMVMTNTTQSIIPDQINLTNGIWTGTAAITISPNNGLDIITVYYGAIKKSATITVFVDAQQGGTVTIPGVEIVFGPQTLGTTNATVHIATSTTATPPQGIQFIEAVYNIELKDESGTKIQPIGSVTLRFDYPDNPKPGDGWIDGTNIREENLVIYHWNNITWTALTTYHHGTENYVWTYISHFSTFTVGGTPT